MKIVIKVLRGVIIAVLTAVILANMWLLIQQKLLKRDPPGIFGYYHFIVTSGSMEPTFSAGDLVIARERESYRPGTVVTFRDGEGSLVTHRIVGTVEGSFITQGDANNVQDRELLSPDRIVAEVVTYIPGAGSIILFFRSPLGILVLLAVGVLLVEMPSWTGALRRKAKGKHANVRE